MHRAVRVGVCVIGVLACLGGGTGCARELFPEKEPRTQFETYDRIRQRSVPLTQPDVFGRPRPALRARLAPS